ncbi:hypothetical protein [Citrobacter arsenatis]|uniref:hypothetical protein n=1 Tax=Citrobacter arsenatis TaxID=2546350 RepID=UPI00300E45CC
MSKNNVMSITRLERDRRVMKNKLFDMANEYALANSKEVAEKWKSMSNELSKLIDLILERAIEHGFHQDSRSAIESVAFDVFHFYAFERKKLEFMGDDFLWFFHKENKSLLSTDEAIKLFPLGMVEFERSDDETSTELLHAASVLFLTGNVELSKVVYIQYEKERRYSSPYDLIRMVLKNEVLIKKDMQKRISNKREKHVHRELSIQIAIATREKYPDASRSQISQKLTEHFKHSFSFYTVDGWLKDSGIKGGKRGKSITFSLVTPNSIPLL